MSAVRRNIIVAASIGVLALLGFYWFPGHTYLQSDSQIYVPMLEHLWDPTVLTHDFMVQRPHMAFTIYDEVAVAARRLTGLGFREVLTAQQVAFRALGLLGVFLLASSLKLGTRMSLLVTAIFALGATIGGPTVLTIEYEPIPRAFALPLLLLATGMVAQGRDLGAGLAASLAFLYHPNTTLAFWAVYFCLACWPAGFPVMRRRILGLAPLLVAVLLLLVSSRLQTGVTESPDFLSRIAPWWEQILKSRAPYIWVSLWFPRWHWHYGILWLVSLLAFWRIRKEAGADLRFFLIGLPLLGVLSVPASYLLLEVWKSALGPQMQLARNVLFITSMAGLLASAAGVKAVQAGRRLEGFGWLVIAWIVPAGEPVQRILFPGLGDPVLFRRLALGALLAAATVLITWLEPRRLRWGIPAWAALVLLPSFLFPSFGKMAYYPQLHDQDLEELSGWARSSTDKHAMFLFPDAGRNLYPGVFRARALRAVYVDWKAGGQGNYLPSVGHEWWKRWQALGALKYKRGNIQQYAQYGVDYVVVGVQHAEPGEAAAFENSSFVVYRIR